MALADLEVGVSDELARQARTRGKSESGRNAWRQQ
jgi:hypothetical protein